MKKSLIWIFWLGAVITILLRVPSWFEPYSYADEGIYLVLGRAFKKGWVFYRDIHDNKPPLLYIVAGIAGTVRNFRLILTGWNLINLFIIFKIAKKMFQNRFWPVLVSTVSFSVLSSLPFWEGQMANGELFMIMPLSLTVYLLMQGLKKQKIKFFWLAGLVSSIGFLFKVPMAFDLVGIALWLLWLQIKSQKKWLKVLKQWGALVGGFLVLNLIFGVYYFFKGAGERYLMSALLQNLPYLTSWDGPADAGWFELGLMQRGLIVVFITGLVFVFQKKLNKWQAFLSLWFVFSLFGALLSGRPYTHYLIEVVPVFSLILGLSLIKEWKNWLVAGASLAMVWFSFEYFDFWQYPVYSYYQNFVDLALKKKSLTDYQRYWGDQVLMDIKAGEVIKKETEENDLIFVWGTAPGVYYQSDRLPVGRYTVAYHIADFNGFQETMTALKKEKPKVVVVIGSETMEFNDFFEWLKEDYVLDQVIGDRLIYIQLHDREL